MCQNWIVSEFFETGKCQNYIQILTLSGFEKKIIPWNSDTFRFQIILTLSSSDTFRFWHFQVLTLSDSDTFRIGTKNDSDTFMFLLKSALRKYEPAYGKRDQWYLRGWDIGPPWGPLPQARLDSLYHGHSTKTSSRCREVFFKFFSDILIFRTFLN